VFWGSQPQWWQRVAGEISRALVMPAF
jgi:hypothetical protein